MCADVAQQTLRRILHHIEHAFEALRAAVIRIGHRNRLATHAISHEQREFGHMLLRTIAREQLQIVFIHRQQVVKTREIGGCDLPCA